MVFHKDAAIEPPPEADPKKTISLLQKRVESLTQELAQRSKAEADLNDFFENSVVPLHWVNAEGLIIRANRAELELLGYREDEYVGRPISDFHVDSDTIADILTCLGSGKAIHAYPARLRCKDGTVRHVLIDSNVYFKDGKFVHTRCFTRDVTQNVLAKDAIQNERENFRNLFKQTPEMVCILKGPEHVFEFVNDAHIRALGFDATGMAVRKAQPESVEVHGILDRVYQTGVTAQLHEIPVTVTDRVRYFNLTYAARRAIDGSTNGVMILGTEVTGDVLMRQELERSQRRLRDLANSISHIVWVTDKDGRIDYYNDRWFEFTGFTIEQSKDVGIWRQTIHPEDFERVAPAWHEALRTRTIFEAEWRMKGREGVYRWHLVRTVPAFDDHGQVVAWYGTSTDIDAQKRLRERSRLFADVGVLFSESLEVERTLQSLADIVVQNLADWCVIAVAEDGKPPREAAVAHPDPGYIPVVRELFKDYPTDWSAKTGAPNVIRTGRAELYSEVPEALLQQASRDERHFRLLKELGFQSAMIVPLVARARVLGAITFISSRSGRRYMQDDMNLAVELGRRAGMAVDAAMLFEQAQKAVRARDEFMSIASHELKTPLTSLKLQAHIRAREVARGEFRKFSADKLPQLIADDEKQLNRLNRLVDDMLDITRIQSGKLTLTLEELDLNDLVKEALARLSAQVEATRSTVSFKPGPPARGRWDRFRVEQVFVNLLTNALKYGAGNPIEVGISADTGRAELTVSDRGMGIRQEDQERIFGQFERAVSADSISGLGLGLYISRMIVEAHGGRISVSSKEGQGSVFTVELPL
jgi:PAS domain S-box-containing protein